MECVYPVAAAPSRLGCSSGWAANQPAAKPSLVFFKNIFERKFQIQILNFEISRILNPKGFKSCPNLILIGMNTRMLPIE